MKSHTKPVHSFLAACLLIGLLFTSSGNCSAQTQPPQVTWYAAPYSHSPQYLETLVDTRTLPFDAYLMNVKFFVKCRNRNTGRLTTNTLSFTDAAGQASGAPFMRLNGGRLYRRFLKLPSLQAKFVQATQLQYLMDVAGSEPMKLPHKPIPMFQRTPLAGSPTLPPTGTAPTAQPSAKETTGVWQGFRENERARLAASLLPPKRVTSKKRLHPARIITLGQEPPTAP